MSKYRFHGLQFQFMPFSWGFQFTETDKDPEQGWSSKWLIIGPFQFHWYSLCGWPKQQQKTAK